MPRKISPKTEIKPFDNVNVKTKGSTLRRAQLLWGNKTLAATKALETYLLMQENIGMQFSSLFTFEETKLLIEAFPEPASSLIRIAPVKDNMIKTLTSPIFSTRKSFRSCLEKLKTLSDLELSFLLLEIERIITVRTYCDDNYLSFTDLIEITD